MQQAENKIAETLAASRLNEAQLVGGQQENAVKSLVSMQNLKDDTGWKQYQALAASANPADQAAAAKWLAENSAQGGFQRPDNAVEMSDAAVKAALNDPAYIASQAQQQLEAKKQTSLLNASSLGGADKIKSLFNAGLVDEARSATSSLPTTGNVGDVVNREGHPVKIAKANRQPFTNHTLYEGTDILTGETVRYWG